MQLLNTISNAAGSDGIQKLGNRFGLGASAASGATGVSPDIIKQLLPVLAALTIGALSKKTDGGRQLATDAQGGGLRDIMSSFLGSNHNGSAMDEGPDLAKKFF